MNVCDRTELMGKPAGSFCPDCDHLVGVHEADGYCSICRIVHQVRAVVALEDWQVKVLLWLAERTDGSLPIVTTYQPKPSPCYTCGHDRQAHVVGGDADDPTPWPCMYPQILGAPQRLCDCEDFQPQQSDAPEWTI